MSLRYNNRLQQLQSMLYAISIWWKSMYRLCCSLRLPTATRLNRSYMETWHDSTRDCFSINKHNLIFINPPRVSHWGKAFSSHQALCCRMVNRCMFIQSGDWNPPMWYSLILSTVQKRVNVKEEENKMNSGIKGLFSFSYLISTFIPHLQHRGEKETTSSFSSSFFHPAKSSVASKHTQTCVCVCVCV